MARLPTPGSDDGTWGDVLNDFLNQSHNPNGSLKSSAVSAAGALQSSNNLSDVASAATSRTNLGVPADTSVVHLSGTETVTGNKNFTGTLNHSGNAVVDTTDSRLSDARTPTAHHTTHAPGASDPIDYSLVNLSGLLAARPAAATSNAGLFYYATDDNGGTLYRSDGLSWNLVSAPTRELAYAERLTDMLSITSTSYTDITSLSITFTPGSNPFYMEAYFGAVAAASAGQSAWIRITDNTATNTYAEDFWTGPGALYRDSFLIKRRSAAGAFTAGTPITLKAQVKTNGTIGLYASPNAGTHVGPMHLTVYEA